MSAAAARTAASASSSSSPSPFASLLRRSKFASYDPKIGQVYTTHGGHAHRGDWGFKRPLANRRRDARITVSNVDSCYQQTEWRSAYLDSTFVRKRQETGSFPVLRSGPWAQRVGAPTSDGAPWQVYSEYAMGSGGGEGPESVNRRELSMKSAVDGRQPVPNVDAMTDHQFEDYLRRIRKERPAFKEYVQRYTRTPKEGLEENLQERNRNPLETDSSRRVRAMESPYNQSNFITKWVESRVSDPTSTTIQQMPHPNAGLDYTHAPSIQQAIFSKPLRGKRLMLLGQERSTDYMAVVGGWTARETHGSTQKLQSIDMGSSGAPRTNPDQGVVSYKVRFDKLIRAPSVVGAAPERVDSVDYERQIIEYVPSIADKYHVPYPPGSREYVGYVGYEAPSSRAGTITMTRARKSKPVRSKSVQSDRESSDTLLESLRRAVVNRTSVDSL